MLSSTLLPFLLLPTFVLTNALFTPPNNLFHRQAEQCKGIAGGIPCPGGQYCCPMMWECKTNEPSICTANISDSNMILTVSAIDWAGRVESASRNVQSFLSELGEIGASLTGGVGASVGLGSVTGTSTAVLASSTGVVGEASDSGSLPGGIVGSPTPTLQQQPPPTASIALATTTATGAARMPVANENIVIGVVVGLCMVLI